MDDPMSVDLRKLKKAPPPPVVHMAPPTPVSSPAPFGMPPTPPPVPPRPVAMPAASAAAPQKPPFKPKRTGGFPLKKAIIAAVTTVLVLGGGYYIYSNVWTRSPFGVTPQNSPTQPAAAATPNPEPTEAELVAKVGALMVLPEGETPVLAKVSDLAALQGQAFFAHAKVGNIVLMFQKAARAILYDPETNKIVEVGPIQNATSTVQTAP